MKAPPGSPSDDFLQPGLLLDRRLLDVIHLRKLFSQISVSLRLKTLLRRAVTAWGAFAVTGIKLVHHIHAFRHHAKGCETAAVKVCIVPEVDENLGGTRIRTIGPALHRKGDVSPLIAFFYRIAWNPGIAQHRIDRRIATDTELHHESCNDAEKSCIVKKPILYEVIEAVCTVGSPIAVHVDFKCAGTRIKVY